MIGVTTWATNRRARTSLRWLIHEWLPRWAILPGAHQEPHPDHATGAQNAANEVLGLDDVWVHHRNRVIAKQERNPSLDTVWGVAMRCARGAAAHAMATGQNPRAVLNEARLGIREAAPKRLDTPPDPFEGALS